MQRRKPAAPADRVKMQAHISQQDRPRGTLRSQHFDGLPVKFAELFLQHHDVKVFLALEVIVQQRLVDGCLGSDRVDAGSGKPGLGKNPLRGGEDGRARATAGRRQVGTVSSFGAGRHD